MTLAPHEPIALMEEVFEGIVFHLHVEAGDERARYMPSDLMELRMVVAGALMPVTRPRQNVENV